MEEKKKRVTKQKQIILQTLASLGSHVSASAVYKELQESNPTIGRSTVFRVLSDMADEGLILRIKTIEGDDRYDTTAFDHCHVVCRKCGRVDDVWFDTAPDVTRSISSSSGFTVEKTHIEFIGLCNSCRKTAET